MPKRRIFTRAFAFGAARVLRLSLIVLIWTVAGCGLDEGAGRPTIAVTPVPKRFTEVQVSTKTTNVHSIPVGKNQPSPPLRPYSPDGRAVSSLTWSLVGVDAARRRLVLSIDEGACSRAPMGVLVREDSAIVKVTVLAKPPPSEKCTMQRVYILASVQLARPLGGRRLLQGAL